MGNSWLLVFALLIGCPATTPYGAPPVWKARPLDRCFEVDHEVVCVYADEECVYWIHKTPEGWEEDTFTCLF